MPAGRLVAGALFVLLAAGMTMAVAEEGMLDRYRETNRLLLVFAPAADDARLQRQLAVTRAAAAGMAERDLLTIAIVDAAPVQVDGRPAADLKAEALRATYKVPADAFTAILVGKDGTEKMRDSEPIGTDTLFATIDEMPMRRQEMRRQRQD